ncbi:MAG: ATP phosphoribosyltransferase [Spirochaetota bacterium]
MSSAETTTPDTSPLSIALPKGRLLDSITEAFRNVSIDVSFDNRKLVSEDTSQGLEFFLVKNSDLPVYVNFGIAGLGICGEDVLYESSFPLVRLATFPFGSTRMCLAHRADHDPSADVGTLSVATKFIRFARDYFHRLGIPVQVIRLNGSVELAPVLGLCPYIVDLVETGSTLKANNLVVAKELAVMQVHLVANPAYYKFHYKRVNDFVRRLLDNHIAEPIATSWS